MSDIGKAQKFLEEYKPDLEGLLGEVEETCRQVKKVLGDGVIDDIYGRMQSTSGKFNFKEPIKIITKLREQGKTPTVDSFLELDDIVGLTVVIRYPAQVTPVIDKIRAALCERSDRIDTSEPDPKKKDGYYATHLTCKQNRGGNHIRCEIQVKTMLHNAMSAKMHDLTYKPTGILDPRLKNLMASIANTIENLEQQSQLIHDAVKANWNVEEATRQAARDELFDGMLKFLWRATSDSEINGLQAAVMDLQKKLKNGDGGETIRQPQSDESRTTVDKLTAPINTCCACGGDKLRHGWIIAARLASLYPKGGLSPFAKRHLDHWLEIAPGLLAEKQIEETEITAIPLVFYVLADLERAIDYCDPLIQQPGLTDKARARLKFNKATFQIEREYHSPTKPGPGRDELRAELKRVLESAEIDALDSKAAILDTKGELVPVV